MSTKRHCLPEQRRTLPEQPPRLDRSDAARMRNHKPCKGCRKLKCTKIDRGCFTCLEKGTLCSYEERNHDQKEDTRNRYSSSPEDTQTDGGLVGEYERNDGHMTTDTQIKSDGNYDSSVVINGDNTNRMDPRNAAQRTDGFPAPGCKSGLFGHMVIIFRGNPESTMATFVHCDPDGTLHYGAACGDLDWNITDERWYSSKVGPSDVFGEMRVPYDSGDHMFLPVTNDSTVYAGREYIV